jgi:hypothetical protein
VHLSKINIADGFNRMWINADDVPKLGVIFLTAPGKDPLVGFTLVLPMGWMQPPPLLFFTVMTKTVSYLANKHLALNAPCADHHLDQVSEAVPLPQCQL